MGWALYGDNRSVINIHPNPYMGRTGPIKNPLFWNFLSKIQTYIVSIINPKKE